MNNLLKQIVPQELKDLVKRWKPIGLLEGASGWEEIQLACLLENQRLLNELLLAGKKAPVNTIFYRISIPLVRRVFDPVLFTPFQMISIQTMAGPNGLVYYTDSYNVFRNSPIQARNRYLRSTFPIFESKEKPEGDEIKPWFADENTVYLTKTFSEIFDQDYTKNMDKEVDLTAVLGRAIQQEIIREVIADLRTVIFANPDNLLTHQWRSAEHFVDYFRIASSQLGKLVGGEATWLLVSSVVGKELSRLPEDLFRPDVKLGSNMREDQDVHRIGELARKWTVYVDPKFQDTEVLYGKRSRENPLDAGYFYCPYCPFSIQQIPSQDTRIMARYTKKLINDKYYGAIKILNFVPTEEPVVVPEVTELDPTEEVLEEMEPEIHKEEVSEEVVSDDMEILEIIDDGEETQDKGSKE
jgi:hypothetical protein